MSGSAHWMAGSLQFQRTLWILCQSDDHPWTRHRDRIGRRVKPALPSNQLERADAVGDDRMLNGPFDPAFDGFRGDHGGPIACVASPATRVVFTHFAVQITPGTQSRTARLPPRAHYVRWRT
jgi:hypothetical protein